MRKVGYMPFRLLFIGDVVGEVGCAAVRALVPTLRRELELDAVIVNAENSASSGRGITPDSGSALLSVADFLTLGNHAFDAEGGREYLGYEQRVIRPANFAEKLPGRGWGTFEVGDVRVGVANLQGRVFMRETPGSPFKAADEAVTELEGSEADLILVDMHAEATSEKQAMGYYLQGRVQALLGTHTHVPTADARILSGGTVYVTDVGMTGSMSGIIGLDKEDFMDLFLGRKPSRIGVSEGPAALNAVLIEVDVEGRRATGIERVYEEPI
ncbi:MAG TPA: TIGR00282 family metallophosphoesterase [Rubrobacteraceae bacterium]|nr:TIGR00282 family metallophosphoesterase [Rubrobacteraceae bacterium]